MSRPRAAPVLPAHRWAGLSRRQRIARRAARWWRGARWWLGLALILAAMSQFQRLPLTGVGAWLFPRPGRTMAPPAVREAVSQSFRRCGDGGLGPNCVSDGDTFVMGPRRIRVAGVDAPELHPARCPEEARLGEAAAAALLAWLNAGPFELTAASANAYDEYGRELRDAVRVGADGKRKSLAEALVKTGTVRVFLRGQRGTWCVGARR